MRASFGGLYLTFACLFSQLLAWFFVSNTVSILDVIASPWESVQELIRSECNDYFGLTILEAVGFEGICDGYAMLTVPDELRQNWINTHYSAIFRKAFSSVFGSAFKDYRIRQVAPSGSVPEVKLSAPAAPVLPPVVRTQPKARAARPKLKLYAGYTFEKFIEGSCNSTAYKACKAVSENPGDPGLNPLFVYGKSGLGKTHLLQSIAASVQKTKPQANVVYCHAFDFLRDATAVAKALKLKTGNVRELAQAFQNKYENCDILLLDDVQLIEKGITTQERLAILIRHLRSQGKQVVISCDRHPSKFNRAVDEADFKAKANAGVPCISSKLLAPLDSCVAVGLDEPDLNTRMRLIQQKSIDIPFVDRDREEIYRFLSIPPRQNFRVIEGLLVTLGAMNDLCQQNLDLQTVKRLLSTSETSSTGEVTPKSISEVVAAEFGVDMVVLASKRQDLKASLPRKVAMYLCREMTTESLANVGAMFNRDYATVIAAIQSLKKQMDKDADLKQKVQDIQYLLEA